jgi:hypothetical protein
VNTAPAAVRFWDLVNGPWTDPRIGGEDCWRWMGATAGSRAPKHWKRSRKPWRRYGRFWYRGRMENAHRVALILTIGEPPDPAMVSSHTKCDTPLCCNPTHLAWATQEANIREAIAKGRLGRRFGRFAVAAAAVVG